MLIKASKEILKFKLSKFKLIRNPVQGDDPKPRKWDITYSGKRLYLAQALEIVRRKPRLTKFMLGLYIHYVGQIQHMDRWLTPSQVKNKIVKERS
jgi:hypothetical protein